MASSGDNVNKYIKQRVCQIENIRVQAFEYHSDCMYKKSDKHFLQYHRGRVSHIFKKQITTQATAIGT